MNFDDFSDIFRRFTVKGLGRVVLVALLAGLCCQSMAASIAEASSKVGSLSTLTLPSEMESLEDYALSGNGMVFVADKHAVWVRSPWGWERIWALPETKDSSDQRINTIAVVKDARESEVLLVGTEEGIWSISWSQEEKAGEPWSVFALHFSGGMRLTKAAGGGDDTSRISSLVTLAGSAESARALAVSRSGISRLIIPDGGALTVGPAPFGEDILQDVVAFPLPGGHCLCQEYRDGEIRFISAAGVQLRKTDLGTLFGGKTQLRTAIVDQERRLLFVGTDRGVLSARVDENGVLEGEWQIVDALRGFDAFYLGWCAKRLLVIGNPLETSGTRDAVQWETRLNSIAPAKDDFARRLTFAPASGGDFPSDIMEALTVADDAVWVRARDRVVYEWTPKQWRRLSSAEHGGLDSPDFWRTKARTTPPLVIPDDSLHRLTWLTPHDPRRITYHEFDTQVAALVPDPSGVGFWSLDRPMPGMGKTFHSLRFHSGHGQFDTTDEVNYGRQPEVARVEHAVAQGGEFAEGASATQRIYYPESDDGSLLLPSGADLFRVNRAEWQKLKPLNPLPEPDRLVELTPGAASSDAPWLALRLHADSSADLVRLDVDGTLAAWKITSLGVQIPAQASARLIPESNGYVWLAIRQTGVDWVLQRISAAKETLRISTPVNEVPRFIISRRPTLSVSGPLLSRQIDRHIFTESGVVVCEDDHATVWRSLLTSAASERPQFLGYFFGENDAFVRTGTIDAGGNPTAGPVYLLKWSGSRVDLATATGPPNLPMAEPFAFFPAKLTGRPSAFWTLDTSVTQTNVARTWWSASGTTAALPFLFWDENTFDLPLPRLRELDAAAVIAGSEFKHTTPEVAAIFGASSGSSLVLIPPASPLGWETWIPPVPVELTARKRDGKNLKWSLRDAPPPSSLLHDVVEIGIRFARDYDSWWQSFPWLLRGRAFSGAGGDAPPWQPADVLDVVRFSVESGRHYVLEFESAEANGASYSGIRTLPMAVEPDPGVVPPRIVALIGALILGIAVLLILTFSRVARLALLRVLGRRWVFRTEDCDVVVEAIEEGGGILLTADRGGAVAVRQRLAQNDLALCAADDEPVLERIRTMLLPPLDDSLQTISVRTPESLFHHPFGQWLDEGWASLPLPGLPHSRWVSGQTAVLPQMLAAPPRRLKQVRFASIGWSGTPPLLIEPELAAIETTFRRIRADILPRGESPAGLLDALCEADVVHVAAHASLTEIELRDSSFTAALLTDHLLSRIRCRLLILSACDAGRTAPDQPSIAWPLIRAGVTVVGSLVPLDDTVARRFFPLLYESFLPVTTAEGLRFAEAIVRASTALEAILGAGADAPWRAYLNRLVLYGNPNLRLTVFHSAPN